LTSTGNTADSRGSSNAQKPSELCSCTILTILLIILPSSPPCRALPSVRKGLDPRGYSQMFAP
jgi:hypothetical protein